MPGVLLSQATKETMVTPRGKEISLEEEIGASISFPRNSVTENTSLGIATSFSGSYDLPKDMVSVSPAYVINMDERVEFREDVTMRMRHTANSEDLVLLVADATPTDNRYKFRVSMDSRVECYAGKRQFGVVKMKSLFSQLFKIGKKRCEGIEFFVSILRL